MRKLLLASFVPLVALLALLSQVKADSSVAWDRESQLIFVEALCSDDSYFRKCFDVTKPWCVSAVGKSAEQCKTTVSRSSNAVQLHAKIGLCVGARLEKSWSDRKSAATECRTRERWQ